ncbi:MAG: LysE family translocator [Halochromatium sp.]|uniref:LysE family translocator n=1 Tax=Halochromatium sp. TaxID=2049430 RepID=UPI00397B7DA1
MTPGPSLAVVLGSMLRGGRGAGLAAALAHGLAVGLYAVLTVAGLATLLTASPTLFALLQFAAAGYLVFLASGALRQRAAMTPATDGSISHDRPGMAARDGFMIAFLNPKLAVFMLALFAPFITADQGLGAKALLVLTIGGIDALWYSTVVLVMVRSGLLSALARNAINVQRVYAALLLALALFVTSRAAGNWVLEKADPDGSEHRNATCQCTHDPIAGQFRLSSSETTYRRLQQCPSNDDTTWVPAVPASARNATIAARTKTASPARTSAAPTAAPSSCARAPIMTNCYDRSARPRVGAR